MKPHKRYTLVAAYLSCCILLSLPAAARAFEAKVIAFDDGDSFTVLHHETRVAEKIRLYGIDCPEGRQPFGYKARKFTSGLILDRVISIQPVTTDKDGRTVALVYLPDERCLNQELVKDGFAWVYRKYCKKPLCKDWLKLEAYARQNKIGLWSQPNPVPPWQYRHKKKREKNKGGSYKQFNRELRLEGSYHGNTTSRVFHRAGCTHYNCSNCSEIFTMRTEALDAGYKPCGRCRP